VGLLTREFDRYATLRLSLGAGPEGADTNVDLAADFVSEPDARAFFECAAAEHSCRFAGALPCRRTPEASQR
jgi:hypothetical protein